LIFVFKNLVKRHLTDKLADRELGGDAHLFGVIVNFRHDFDEIIDLVDTNQIQTQRNLVFGQNLLSGDVHLLLPRIREIEADALRALPVKTWCPVRANGQTLR
jgi:hypothetical protein